MLCQLAQGAAGAQLRTVAAGVIAFLHYALANLAKVIAVVGLAPLRAASHAVYPFGLELHLVHFAPFLRHFLARTVVIVQGG